MINSMTSRLLATTAVCAIVVGSASAQTPTPQEGTTVLSPIVVDAPAPSPGAPRKRNTGGTAPAAAKQAPSALDALSTSSEKSNASVYDAPGTVTVKSTAEMERQNINTPRDFVRDEPGLSYGNQPTRGGGTNYWIRGVGENRVRVEVDGIKVQDFPGSNVGSPSGYTVDYLDLDAMKRVEIIRGPASALYGSDSIGGVVSYVTKDPADYLALVNKDWYLSTKAGFDSVDRSFYTTITGANRVGNVDSMLLVTRRLGHEVTANGSLPANSQSYMTSNVLGKIVYNTFGAGQITLTGELMRRTTDIDLLNERSSTVLNSTAEDTNQRKRLSLDWKTPVNWWFADTAKFKIYGTQATREEISEQRRSANTYRFSDFDFDQTIFGGEMQFQVNRSAFGAVHQITYGASIDQTSTTRPRTRFQTNGAGVTTETISVFNPVLNVFDTEKFPNKNFPDTKTTQAAVYVQDVAQWGAFRFIPAVRFDFYQLEVNPDQLFLNSNPSGFVPGNLQASEISPKLGATYDFTKQFRWFGQYAHGFRAPPYDSSNLGFKNPAGNYEIQPNFNLRPETVDGFETGFRGHDKTGSSWQVTAFHNKYKDFIDTVTLAPVGGVTQFQYQNISNVTIQGVEAKAEWRFMPTWALFGSAAYAYGVNDDTGGAINSVDPLKGVVGIRYRGYNGFGAELRTTMVSEKTRVSGSPSDPSFIPFKVPGYGTIDALFSYEAAPSMTFNLGFFNILNASYFNPIDVAGISANSTGLERYRAPGASIASNVTFRW